MINIHLLSGALGCSKTGFELRGGKCYYISEIEEKVADAEAFCATSGSILAVAVPNQLYENIRAIAEEESYDFHIGIKKEVSLSFGLFSLLFFGSYLVEFRSRFRPV